VQSSSQTMQLYRHVWIDIAIRYSLRVKNASVGLQLKWP